MSAAKAEEKTAEKSEKTAEKTAIVKAVAAEVLPPGVTVTALDKAVNAIHTLKGESSRSMWRLGSKIHELFEKHLWKARQSEAGKGAYTSFNGFCTSELGMSAANAYKMMDISQAFSEDDVMKFGPSKLGLILEVPEGDRQKLLDVAEKKSKREVAADVQKVKKGAAKDGATPTKRKTGRKEMPAGKPRAAAPSADKITVAQIEGNRRVLLFKRPEKGDTSEPKPAKKLADQPYGSMDLANGVRMFFSVVEAPSGQLVLQVKTVRQEALSWRAKSSKIRTV